jgi:excisionase family DNA binding protein
MIGIDDRLAFGREESAALLGISRSHLDGLIFDKTIKAIKSGQRTLITREELKRYLATLPAAVIKYPEKERERLAKKDAARKDAAKRKAAGAA